MVGIDVKKTEKELIIKWQLTKITIPLEDIIKVSEDNTYGGAKADAIRIGPPYGTTDRIFIETKKQDYIIFTTNKHPLMEEINS
ncbi:hypothetical protein SFC65_19690 [Priestia filamentosa]|uniref:SunI/YnzG family protein n=1 Tax=Priestia filamentosa TaxID=1402861 RepID=UPI003982D09A